MSDKLLGSILYWATLLFGALLIFAGALSVVAPASSLASFGLAPLNELASGLNDNQGGGIAAHLLVVTVGGRNLALGFIVIALTFQHNLRALCFIVMLGVIIPIVDAYAFYDAGFTSMRYLISHLLSSVYVMILGAGYFISLKRIQVSNATAKPV